MKMVSLILSLFITAGLFGQTASVVSYSPENCTSFIDINGKTNLSNFHLSQVLDHQLYLSVEDTHWSRTTDSSSMTEIHIPVKQFSTGNPFLYHDFLDLLKAREHPEIIIQIRREQLESVALWYELHRPSNQHHPCRNHAHLQDRMLGKQLQQP